MDPRGSWKAVGVAPSSGRPSIHHSLLGQRRPAVADDGEEAIEIRGPEHRLDGGRELAEPEPAAGPVDPTLEQDQLAEHPAGDQVDPGEVEDDPDRLAV